MNRVTVSIGVGLLLTFASPALAQDPDARALIRNEVVFPVALDPSLGSPIVSAPYTSFTLHADETALAGTFHLGLKHGDTTYGLLLSAPLNTTTSTATFLDQTGLRSQTSIGFDFTDVLWGDDPTFNAGITNSRTARLSALGDGNFSVPLQVKVAVNYQYGRKTYDFKDASTLADGTETHDAHNFSVTLGVQFGAKKVRTPGYLITGTWTDKTTFKAGKTTTLCSPYGSTGSTACNDVVIGAPVEQSTKLLSLDGHLLVANAKIGLQPNYTYSTTSGRHTWQSSAFVMFETSATPKPGDEDAATINNAPRFNVGATVGWESAGKDAKGKGLFVSVFVAPAFKIGKGTF